MSQQDLTHSLPSYADPLDAHIGVTGSHGCQPWAERGETG